MRESNLCGRQLLFLGHSSQTVCEHFHQPLTDSIRVSNLCPIMQGYMEKAGADIHSSTLSHHTQKTEGIRGSFLRQNLLLLRLCAK